MIIDSLLPLITKAIMVIVVSEFLNKWTPKWLKPTYILPVISIGIVYFYTSEFLIADSVVVMSFAVLLYEFAGKDIIKKLFTKLKDDRI